MTTVRQPFRYRGFVLGRVIVTTCMQAAGAPVADPATCQDTEGRHYRGRAILLKPWRARTDSTVRSRALVLGVRRP